MLADYNASIGPNFFVLFWAISFILGEILEEVELFWYQPSMPLTLNSINSSILWIFCELMLYYQAEFKNAYSIQKCFFSKYSRFKPSHDFIKANKFHKVENIPPPPHQEKGLLNLINAVSNMCIQYPSAFQLLLICSVIPSNPLSG